MADESYIEFYDSLSKDYHLIFQDWDASIRRQAKILDDLIIKYRGKEVSRILDCSCGIGTQALGLSACGYEVYGTDVSSQSIGRAREEAQKRQASIRFAVADMRRLQQAVKGTFEVVISCDNALPHLLEDEEIVLAGKNILAKMEPDALFIASIRDYDKILQDKPSLTQPLVKMEGDTTTISFQTWNWLTEDIYLLNHNTLSGKDQDFKARLRTVRYRAYKREHLSRLFSTAGFEDCHWLMEEESGYYQPILIAKKIIQ